MTFLCVLKKTPESFEPVMHNNMSIVSVTCIVQELCESRWPSLAVHLNEPSGFPGRKDLLNHASALVSACP